MILVFIREFKNGSRRARLVTKVTDICAFGDTFMWKRSNQKSAFHIGLDVDSMEEKHVAVFAMCDFEDAATLGVNEEHLIKWIIWNHEFIASMTESEAHKFIKLNPLL